MTDPYKVLGVSPNATDDEVKDAYRRLARKYHPDNYVNNPLSDLATEKMKEINEAYDEIQRQRKSGGSGYGQQSYGGGYQQSYGGYQRNYGGYQQSYGGSSQFADIRRLINLNRLGDAEELLDGISASARTAEWNYLKGIVNYRKGWLDEATQHFQMACNMDPANGEYRQALMMMRQGGQAYRPYGYGGGIDACDCCTACLCMNMCCGN